MLSFNCIIFISSHLLNLCCITIAGPSTARASCAMSQGPRKLGAPKSPAHLLIRSIIRLQIFLSPKPSVSLTLDWSIDNLCCGSGLIRFEGGKLWTWRKGPSSLQRSFIHGGQEIHLQSRLQRWGHGVRVAAGNPDIGDRRALRLTVSLLILYCPASDLVMPHILSVYAALFGFGLDGLSHFLPMFWKSGRHKE
jgi:hypothetical protein